MGRPCNPRLQSRLVIQFAPVTAGAPTGPCTTLASASVAKSTFPACLTLQHDGMNCIIADQSAGGFTMIPELETADFEAILAPLDGDQPTGVDLRQDYAPNSIYFRLRDARAAARDAERQAETEGGDEGLPALWRPVATLAIGALKANSKDLEVATWLTEALVRIAGLRGLMAGASVIGGLVERFWDGVFPMPDEHGMETRLAAVAGLSGQGADGTLMQPLRKSVVFRRPDGSPLSLWQYQAALELSGISDPARRAQRIEAGVVPFEDVEKEARLA
ncbi:MAG: type secretion system protein ImpA, partial [Rhodospirillaceae bacterium]|nr:type secretion system protein ImpA [Rhodospirillaceae bacterium]